jgi:hypothetical protein
MKASRFSPLERGSPVQVLSGMVVWARRCSAILASGSDFHHAGGFLDFFDFGVSADSSTVSVVSVCSGSTSGVSTVQAMIFYACLRASPASTSARSFPSVPAWPRVHSNVTDS